MNTCSQCGAALPQKQAVLIGPAGPLCPECSQKLQSAPVSPGAGVLITLEQLDELDGDTGPRQATLIR